jgi:hypothetical protein
MTITKDQANHNVLSILQISSMLNIYLMNDLTCYNSNKDGDQKIDSICDQLDYNVIVETLVMMLG